MSSSDRDWPLLLRTGYGNIFRWGRWTHDAIVMVAKAINSGSPGAWECVEDWARVHMDDWDDLAAC